MGWACRNRLAVIGLILGFPAPRPTHNPTPIPGGGSAITRPVPTLPTPAPSANVLPQSPFAPSGIGPVIRRDFADPGLIAVEGRFFAYSTNSVYAGRLVHVPVAVSDVLVGPWRMLGDAMPKLPSWVATPEQGGPNVWAPEVTAAAGGGYLLYFTARDAATGVQAIGVASSPRPDGPFRPVGDSPLVLEPGAGDSIDPSPFTDIDGTRYLLYKNGLGYSRMWLQRLSPDGRAFEGEPIQIIRSERADEAGIVEAPSLVRRDGKYLLFFSADAFDSGDYHVSYATAPTVTGPYTKAPDPLVTTDTIDHSYPNTGHQYVITAADGDYLLFHAFVGPNERGMFVLRLDWTADGRPVVHRLARGQRGLAGRPAGSPLARGPPSAGARPPTGHARAGWRSVWVRAVLGLLIAVAAWLGPRAVPAVRRAFERSPRLRAVFRAGALVVGAVLLWVVLGECSPPGTRLLGASWVLPWAPAMTGRVHRAARTALDKARHGAGAVAVSTLLAARFLSPATQTPAPVPPAAARVEPAAVRVSDVTRVAAVTGQDSPNHTGSRFGVLGTDLGIVWVDARGRLRAWFGDTYGAGWHGPGAGSDDQDHRRDVEATIADGDRDAGLPIESMVQDGPAHARELLGADPTQPVEATVIPTAAISVNGVDYVHYMSVRQWLWDSPLGWRTNYSGIAHSLDGGQTWIKDPNARWNNDSGTNPFQLGAFTRDADWVYLFGTPNGRLGDIHLARVAPAQVGDVRQYQYWTGTGWSDEPSAARAVATGPAGEVSVAYDRDLGLWLMVHLEAPAGRIVLRAARSVTGPWSDGQTLATAADYPQLYGGFLDPTTLGRDHIYYVMSQWGPYNTSLFRATLNRPAQPTSHNARRPDPQPRAPAAVEMVVGLPPRPDYERRRATRTPGDDDADVGAGRAESASAATQPAADPASVPVDQAAQAPATAVLLGSDPRADVVVHGAGVKARHASFVERDGQWFVEDWLGNGISVNGEVVRLPIRLSEGDQVGVGDASVAFSHDLVSSASRARAVGDSKVSRNRVLLPPKVSRRLNQKLSGDAAMSATITGFLDTLLSFGFPVESTVAVELRALLVALAHHTYWTEDLGNAKAMFEALGDPLRLWFTDDIRTVAGPIYWALNRRGISLAFDDLVRLAETYVARHEAVHAFWWQVQKTTGLSFEDFIRYAFKTDQARPQDPTNLFRSAELAQESLAEGVAQVLLAAELSHRWPELAPRNEIAALLAVLKAELSRNRNPGYDSPYNAGTVLAVFELAAHPELVQNEPDWRITLAVEAFADAERGSAEHAPYRPDQVRRARLPR